MIGISIAYNNIIGHQSIYVLSVYAIDAFEFSLTRFNKLGKKEIL